MTDIKVGDIVCIKSDTQHKVPMTVEGSSRGRDQCGRSAALASTGSSLKRDHDVSCVWVDPSGNIFHDDFGLEALVKVK